MCKKSAFKRILSALLCLSIVLATSAGLCSCVADESADKLFKKSFGRTIDSMESYDLIKTILTVGKNGSVNTNIVYDDEHNTVSGNLKTYFNSDKNSYFIAADASINGNEYDCGLFISDEYAAIQSSALQENSYGFTLKNYEKKLQSSVFNPDCDSIYALTDKQYDLLLDILEKIDENSKIINDGRKYADKYLNKLLDEFTKNIDITKSSEKTDVLEYEDVSSVMLSMSVTGEDIARTIMTVWEEAKTDKKLKSWVKENIIESEAANALIEDTKTDSVDTFYENIDDIIADFVNELQNCSADVCIWLNTGSGAIMKAEAVISANGEKNKVTLEFGYKFKTFEGFRISTRVAEDDGWSKAETIYLKVLSDTKTELKLQLVSSNTLYIPEITIKYNREDGNVTVSYTGDDDIVIKFTLTGKKGEYVITLGSVSVNGVKNKLPADVTITILEKDKMPEITDYVMITDLTDDEISDISDTIKQDAADIISEIKKIVIGNIFDSVIGLLIG